MDFEEKLISYAENGFNAMFIGSHGVGKSTIVKNIAKKLNLKFKYYSSATLDPWSELIGIPVPDKEKGTVEFYRPKDLENANFIFFDELNRAEPRVLNTVLEIVQFKSINGEPLKNLSIVWAAINPPEEDYQVNELDPALIDRFHFYVNIPAIINIKYLSEVMDEKIAELLKEWWEEDLSGKQKKIITPRRIEYIGTMINCGVPWRDAIPAGYKINWRALDLKIKNINSNLSGFKLTSDSIRNEPDRALEYVRLHPESYMRVAQLIKKLPINRICTVKDIIEELPLDIVMGIFNKWPSMLTSIKEELIEMGCSAAEYPKTFDSINENISRNTK